MRIVDGGNGGMQHGTWKASTLIASHPVTSMLIFANVIVFLILAVSDFVPGLSGLSHRLQADGAVSAMAIADGRIYTLLTSMFLHSGPIHLLSNMYSLHVAGSRCEDVYGKARYLAIYFGTGIAGGLAYVLVANLTGSYRAAVGASGAIFGLMGAIGFLLLSARNASRKKAYALVPQSARTIEAAWGQYLFIIALNIGMGLTTTGIANEAHIGGLIAGFFLGWLLRPPALKPVPGA